MSIKLMVLLFLVGLVLLAVIPGGRSFMAWFFSKPGLKFIEYVRFLVSFLIAIHVTVFRNLFIPRDIIYPTLKKKKTTKR